MKSTIEISVIQSTFDSKYFALDINGLRCGPDAGPWKTIRTFTVAVADLCRVCSEFNKAEKADCMFFKRQAE